MGLQPAGLALARSLGRRGVHVTGISFERADFGLASRYVRTRRLILDGDDGAVLESIRAAASQEPVVLVPERDAHVDFVLRHWDDLRELAAIPLPDDRAATAALRDKNGLAEVAEKAGVAVPRTVAVESEDDLGGGPLPYPYLLKPLESERYAAAFSEKVVVVENAEQAVAAWRRAQGAGFELFAQDFVPGSTDRILSLFVYIGRSGSPLASVVGRKVRQGPPGFGASTIFAVEFDEEVLDVGLRLLSSVDYRGFAHVELVRDPRDRELKLLEVNTRLPVWGGVAMSRYYDLGPVAYADLCGEQADPLPPFHRDVTWTYLAKDLVTLTRLARRRRLDLRRVAPPYLGDHVPAVRARDDFAPVGALLRWGIGRAGDKVRVARRSS
jgi:predicted ATP-grasp superfamily ATP-dependent carboligase